MLVRPCGCFNWSISTAWRNLDPSSIVTGATLISFFRGRGYQAMTGYMTDLSHRTNVDRLPAELKVTCECIPNGARRSTPVIESMI